MVGRKKGLQNLNDYYNSSKAQSIVKHRKRFLKIIIKMVRIYLENYYFPKKPVRLQIDTYIGKYI